MAAAGALHVLLFPYPGQGHLIPLLDLAHRLAAAASLTVTVLVTPQNRPFLDPLLARHPSSAAALVLPFPSSPLLPAGAENVKDLPPGSFRPMMLALSALRDPLLRWFRSHPSPPSVIISDMFLGWTHALAAALGIPRLVFSPSGALALSVIYSLWLRRPSPPPPSDSDAPAGDGHRLVSFPEIPSSPKYPWCQLSPIYRSYVEGEATSEFIREGFLSDVASWGLVVNSFSRAEEPYLAHLKRAMGHSRVWAVGPLLHPGDDVERGGSTSVPFSDVASWLDRCGDREAVYVCFGSQAVLSNEQMEAVARGLEGSGARFVWSVKEPAAGHADGGCWAVPTGFEDRAAGRGLVLRGWAPQVQILSHRAVGAFLTHCGWNSVMEGLVAGVAMLAWPMSADQFSNATLVVDSLKVGRRVCEGVRTIPDAAELSRAVAGSVGEEWTAERLRAKDLREAALDAIANGGSSAKDLEDMVSQLTELC